MSKNQYNYGLVILPQKSLYKKTEAIIKRFSQKFKTPFFVPHLTLLGSVQGGEKQIINKLNQLTKNLKPFYSNFGKTEFSSTYFQSVFVRVNMNASLIGLYLKARDIFKTDINHIFMPHLGLIYGDIGISKKEKAALSVNLVGLKFRFNNIWLVKARKGDKPEDWPYIKEFTF
ncbi:hypothetical protein COT75_00850 [Candidatus Beckwithbacteria bacterium CG10_big_fil_rev_8_21_14_0_10_34_10]|uniref:2'-5' RNA ligase n=1 Tax=Candidatus Beckwithbacteria bacterium CG10_big_fil_rev_8_21_14_0_10_34_10 TaxID=1974495 RepID=A0A2H0WA92_9BACT|nr:MAG: hypothetical protein COT75_00850 [Candidatus Beckwithbacteria bacterium CG10_big_fil_rev_8_21_14_0_10_34_10]